MEVNTVDISNHAKNVKLSRDFFDPVEQMKQFYELGGQIRPLLNSLGFSVVTLVRMEETLNTLWFLWRLVAAGVTAAYRSRHSIERL